MATFRDSLGDEIPVRGRRRTVGSLAAVNAEVVHFTNGDESAIIYVNATAGTWNATLEFTGTVDGTNFFPVMVFPIAFACNGGTIPVSAQPLLTEAINTTSVIRAYAVSCAQLAAVRIRVPAFTSGSGDVAIISDAQASFNPNVLVQKVSTLTATATGAASAAVTLTIPATPSLRHYLDRAVITRSATAVLTASATPILITATNIAGNPVFTMGANAAQIGDDKEIVIDSGSTGLATLAVSTATTIVCPAVPGAIWRINALYRLGM